MTSFPCTCCGACCRRIKTAVNNFYTDDPNHPLYFPYSWDSNGVCENLTTDNKCRVYKNRPTLCDIEKFADFIGVKREDFFNYNTRACNKMMDEDGLSLELRIKDKYD
jgi:Fe-S-cluster containining protein